MVDQLHKLLSIGTDRTLFAEGSAVRLRQIENAKNYAELHIIVFTQKSDSFTEVSIAPNCWVYPTQSRSRFFYPFDAIRLGRFIMSRRGINTISCQDPFLTGMAGISLKKQFAVPLELQLHTDIGSPHFTRFFLNKIYKALALSYLPQADRVRVVSNRIKTYLHDRLGIAPDKIEVRPISVTVQSIQAMPVTVDLRTKYPQFEKRILIASRLEKEKNISMALAAYAQVLKKNPRIGLIIVGAGTQASAIKKQISDAGLQNSVIVESWADRPTLVSYYKTADLFLLTSWYEGYGMSLIEAQAAGCRIVSTDVGVAPETNASIVGWNPDDIARGIESSLGV
jgi:glycosyltransferase involved in cell wall biosynthesis